MERVVILGGHGQLGTELTAVLGPRAVPLDHHAADVTNASDLATVLMHAAPTVVINCAAYNLVDRAEDDPAAAHAVNAFGARNVAHWCDEHGVPVLHVSTDYVFGRDATRSTPYSETDVCGPVNVYGTSKAVGESAVANHCPQSWIVRTCGLYGRRATRTKGNFVDTMVRLGTERSEVRVVADQRCTPTSAADLAGAITRLIATQVYGLYHATNAGDCSWAELAAEIFRLRGLATRVIPITTADYGAQAPRPSYSVLDCSKLASALGAPLRPWQSALAEYLETSL